MQVSKSSLLSLSNHRHTMDGLGSGNLWACAVWTTRKKSLVMVAILLTYLGLSVIMNDRNGGVKGRPAVRDGPETLRVPAVSSSSSSLSSVPTTTTTTTSPATMSYQADPSSRVNAAVVTSSSSSSQLVNTSRLSPELRSSTTTTTSTSLSRQSPPLLRLAVIVAGTLQRFNLQSSIQHLIRPLVLKQNVHVDYYLALTTEFAKPYRSNMGYMDRIHWDPIFTNGTITTNPPSVEVAERIIRDAMAQVTKDAATDTTTAATTLPQAQLQHLILRGQMDLDHHPAVIQHRQVAKTTYPEDDDPDARFPIIDIRRSAMSRTANANRNLLRLHMATQELWHAVLQHEQQHKQQTGINQPYDYVLFLRDDALWLEDFDLRGLLKRHATTATATTTSSSPADIFALSCNARDPPLQPEEMNDHALLVTRHAADFFGNYFHHLFHVDLMDCQRTLSNVSSSNGSRGCNSEMILKYAIQQMGQYQIQTVGQGEIPFQRSVHVAMSDGTIQPCFHKFCQSYEYRLEVLDDPNLKITKCTAMTM